MSGGSTRERPTGGTSGRHTSLETGTATGMQTEWRATAADVRSESQRSQCLRRAPFIKRCMRRERAILPNKTTTQPEAAANDSQPLSKRCAQNGRTVQVKRLDIRVDVELLCRKLLVHQYAIHIFGRVRVIYSIFDIVISITTSPVSLYITE